MHHKQWFSFRASGCRQNGKNTTYKFVLANAGECSYPKAWKDYNVCASYDHKNWFRIPSGYDESAGQLHWTMEVTSDQIYFAYFAPYSYERHLDLIARCASLATGFSANEVNIRNKTEVTVRSLGNTLDGRSMDLVTIGSGPLKVWTIARQHPGETMAEFFMEGFIERLLDETDPVTRKLRREATFYCVPNMCPDGSFRGHLRTNACGANLNREWCTTGDYVAPTLERSPEVYHVLAEMDRVGCDMCMDIHGDETLPYNFLSGSEGLPKWGPRLKMLQDHFTEAFLKASPDFQSKYGYDVDPPMEANLALGSNQVGERFDCLSFTFEMPFKDTVDDPNPVTGWSPERCQRLGASILDAVAVVMPQLRA
eukprot:CAMPEP_0170384754 /NCGR_PEP_ID=MMETSP0117_2-20130122/16162_1 /TAXON_ID=400756 /ORGANISM="Durinskia baltica, Strain CSIRO CS-38" /LENGTH=367 /DNA_ID=CAMNT_0010640515 /DNA_START=149 /DNA_END=1252 /DNA_ORIENTATION=-